MPTQVPTEVLDLAQTSVFDFDAKAALLCDVVFAKAELGAWCDRSGVSYTPFETLDDVAAVLLGGRP